MNSHDLMQFFAKLAQQSRGRVAEVVDALLHRIVETSPEARAKSKPRESDVQRSVRDLKAPKPLSKRRDRES
jgi:hypothetical protein